MIADRIGKGLRGVLSDAMVADVTAIEIRGRAFGLRQSLDTIDAFAGPLIAIGLMALFANNMRLVFWVAIIPALLAVVLVLEGSKMHPPLKVLSTQGFPSAYRTQEVPSRIFDTSHHRRGVFAGASQ